MPGNGNNQQRAEPGGNPAEQETFNRVALQPFPSPSKQKHLNTNYYYPVVI
jgi:hypothetical protein